MSDFPRSSTSMSTSDPAPETVLQRLSREIGDAINSTAEGFGDSQAIHAHYFLPKNDLAAILDRSSLQQLFRELIGEIIRGERAEILANSNDEVSVGNGEGLPSNDELIMHYANRTINSSRRALLALFIWEDRSKLIAHFLHWLQHDRSEFPSDNQMPFTKEDLARNGFSRVDVDYILRNQNIFTPVTIQKLKDQKFKTSQRLPFVGAPKAIKVGSSGTVLEAKIARYHWEIEGSNGERVPGNRENTQCVALKEFKAIPFARSKEEATEEFDIESNILTILRKSRIKHEMIMLDWGSITIHDDQKVPICHSFIFELAKFSLEDFLKNKRCAETYRTKSLLLGKLVDIVEALSYLHDHLHILHLDIKPDNILVFEKGSSNENNNNEDGRELTWKLSDFGLACLRKEGQRTDRRPISSSFASPSYGLPATRPAGIYQAPEIQERRYSQACRRSDVWSMGCVTLVVLTFMTGGPDDFQRLHSRLEVDFKNAGGHERLFYVTKDAYSFESADSCKCECLEDFKVDKDVIPDREDELMAAVNPQLIRWLDVLYDRYRKPPERALMQNALRLIFTRVLRIDYRKRIPAKELYERLSDIQEGWKSYEDRCEFSPQNRNATEIPGHMREISHTPPESPGPPNMPPIIETYLTTGSEIPPRIETSPPQVTEMPIARSNLVTEEREACHKLCEASRGDKNAIVKAELERDPTQLKNPCPGCRRYPIYKALENKASEALDELLTRANQRDIRTGEAIKIACRGSGNWKVLQTMRKHRHKFNFTQGMYDENKKDLDSEAIGILKELCKTEKPKKPFWKRS